MSTPEIISQLSQSCTLTVLGMCVVFGFLIILIAFMKLTELFVKATGLDKDKNNEQKSTATKAADDTVVVAAIAAAVREKQIN